MSSITSFYVATWKYVLKKNKTTLFTLPYCEGCGVAPVYLLTSRLSITHPTLATRLHLLPPPCAPRYNYSPHDKWQALSAEISKKPRPLLNEGTLAAPCSPFLSAGKQCPWPSCVPLSFLPPPSPPPLLSVPSSGGLVRGATWRASPAWFISLAPLPSHSGRPKEPTRLQRASTRNPGISWNKPFCRPVKNVLWLAN